MDSELDVAEDMLEGRLEKEVIPRASSLRIGPDPMPRPHVVAPPGIPDERN